MQNKHQTLITDAELLAITAAKSQEQSYIVLSMRLDTENMQVHNLGLTPQQAVRLLRDLTSLATTSEIMKKAIADTPNLYADFRDCMLKGAI